MRAQVANIRIACSGRNLPSKRYMIGVKYIDQARSTNVLHLILHGSIALISVFLLYAGYKMYRRRTKLKNHRSTNAMAPTTAGVRVGSVWCIKEQHKRIQESREIKLFKKECELLAILAANLNQLITRDKLSKCVWEDNGVYVRRSLNTYISKLRKKLQADDNMKITNSHGVGVCTRDLLILK